MKLLSKILFLFALVFALNACSDEPSVVFNENDIEKYETTLEKVASYFETKNSYDLSADCEFLKSLDDVTNVQQNDSLIEVTLKSGMKFTVDYYEQIDDFEVEDINEDKLAAYIDSIDNATKSDIQSGYALTKDVFADYLSSNGGGSKKAPQKKTVSNSPQRTNKSTNTSKIKLTRRNAAIWAPLGGEYKEADDAIKKIANSVLSREGNTIKVLEGFSPSVFASFKDYDLVYMSYHGNKGGIISIPVKALNQSERKEYKDEYKNNRVQGRIKVKDKKKYIYQYDLLETFWRHYLSEANNTIIFSCVCYLGQQNSSFWNGCKSNVADFFGADDECRARRIIQIFQSFYPLFMRGNISTKGAFQRYTDGFMHNGTFYTFTYDRFGTKTVYYLTPHATGVVSGNSPSSQIVVKSQLLYSADESSDILNDIEAGVALKDMETEKVTLIPFSKDNIISDEKKEKDGRVARNISISLSNLTENHKYAYCTYTKTDVETNLSDECYYISTNNSYKLIIRINFNYHEYETYQYYDGTEFRVWRDEITNQTSDFIIEKWQDNKYSLVYCPALGFASDDLGNYETSYTVDDDKVYVKCELLNDNAHFQYTKNKSIDDYPRWDIEFCFIVNDMDSSPSISSYTYEENIIHYYSGIYTTRRYISDVKIVEIKRVELGATTW